MDAPPLIHRTRILISRVLGEVAVEAEDCDGNREHCGVTGGVIDPV